MFKVGDRVRIREWDDMAAEFGTTPNDGRPYINCGNPVFVSWMKEYCGSVGIISHITRSGLVSFEEDDLLLPDGDSLDASKFYFSQQMLELYGEVEYKSSDWDALIGGV